MLGTFKYFGKPDAQHTATTAAVACVVHMFVMHVAEELATWPEHSERQRVWVRPSITHLTPSGESQCLMRQSRAVF